MLTRRSVLVAGNGYVGQRLLAALPAASAIAVNRTAREPINDNPTVAVDLDDASLNALPVTGDAIIYTVPPAAVDGPDPRLSRFVAALANGDRLPQRFVYFSTSGVYGDCGGHLVDESATPRPATSRARRRLAAERLLQSWGEENGVELCILRVPGIYGPGRLGLERLTEGEPVLMDADANPGNRIHVDDLVQCALAAAAVEPVVPLCNVGDGDHRSGTWFAKAVAAEAGLPAPPEIPRHEAERSFSQRRLSFLAESRRLDTSRMSDELGVLPLYADALDG
ncbi:MAG: NAD-dependent epimerase/dehydratase family protein, partial [Woeseia sp.]